MSAKKNRRAGQILGDILAPALTGAAKPQPARGPAKDSPKQRPNPGAAPKHPAPGKKAKVASTGLSKRDIVLNAISTKDGATLGALMTLTGWQAHSVRGAIATMRTQDKLAIVSTRDDAGVRSYRLAEAQAKAPAKKAAAAAAAKKPARKVAKKATAKRTR